MKHNKLSIHINKPITDVFEFTVNPKNTHKWINSIIEEKTSSPIITKGVIYKNTSDNISWDVYTVSEIKENSIFELLRNESEYKVRYTYDAINEKETIMVYEEWDDPLDDPFTMGTLENLKTILEAI